MDFTTPKGLISEERLKQFKAIVGAEFVLADEESLHHYGHDKTEHIL